MVRTASIAATAATGHLAPVHLDRARPIAHAQVDLTSEHEVEVSRRPQPGRNQVDDGGGVHRRIIASVASSSGKVPSAGPLDTHLSFRTRRALGAAGHPHSEWFSAGVAGRRQGRSLAIGG